MEQEEIVKKLEPFAKQNKNPFYSCFDNEYKFQIKQR